MKLTWRLALSFSLTMGLVAMLTIGLTGYYAAGQLEKSKKLMRQDLRLNLVLDQHERLAATGAYIGERLLNPLDNLDVAGLNREIAGIRSWLPIDAIEIVDADYRIVTDGSPRNLRYGDKLDDSRLDSFKIETPHAFSLPEGTGVVFPIRGQAHVAGYARIMLSDAAFLSSVERTAGLLDLIWDRLREGMFALAAFALMASLLVGGGVSWLVSRRLTRPLVEMDRAVRAFAHGNYARRIKIRSRDEIGRLGGSFNKMAEELWKNSRMLAKAREISGVGAWEYNPRLSRFRWTEECSRMLGAPAGELHPRHETVMSFVHPADRERIEALFHTGQARDPNLSEEFRIVRGDGVERTMQLLGEVAIGENGLPNHIVGTIQDITVRRETEERLTHLANFDALTGLPNRYLFQDRLGHALLKADRASTRVGLLFIDLDRFKTINDTLGHGTGDELLKQVAERLHHSVRKIDTVARLGGDEFTALIENVDDQQDAARVATKILAALDKAFLLEQKDVFVTASIGITLYPDDGHQIDQLLRNADIAMYRAKEHGRNTFRFHTAAHNERAKDRLALETALHGALERGEFRIAMQPQLDIASGMLHGFEALLRWRDAHGRGVPPVEFIPVLEDTGTIIEVGAWVLRESCRLAVEWQRRFETPVMMAVNLSPKQFHRGDIVAIVDGALRDSGLPPSLLKLEITETALIDPTGSLHIMEGLKALGVGLAIDDFGTGYSSLAYLKNFPIDILKIDKSFVDDLGIDEDDAQITQAIIGIARGLKLTTVAEGVETVEQLEFLQRHNCDVIQGYLLSPPLEAEAAADWYADFLDAPPAWHTARTAKVLHLPRHREYGVHSVTHP
ncbi:MAG: EAL domain-containing protein [Sulfurisoma sp.]|nr:EAL domain-containing protein [Sulfurisoma sp.]